MWGHVFVKPFPEFLVKPLPECSFGVRIPEIATFSFSLNVLINVRVEICRIARRPMCVYMSCNPTAVKAVEELHAHSKGYSTSVNVPISGLGD